MGGMDPLLFATTWYQNIRSLKHSVVQRPIVTSESVHCVVQTRQYGNVNEKERNNKNEKIGLT